MMSSQFHLSKIQRGRFRYHLSMLLLFAVTITMLKNVQRFEPAESSQPRQSKNLIVNLPIVLSDATDSGASRRYDSFFDCHRKESRCRYFNPNAFFDEYFLSYINDVRRNISATEQLIQWRNEIGLENANLPALTSSSWWADFSDAYIDINDQTRIQLQIDEYFGFSSNLTYIHVHKCGGTSIQSALAKRASRVKKLHFNISKETHTQNKEPSIIEMHSNVHHYKHSYGGGSAQKKEQWDKERIGHIHALTPAVDETKSDQDHNGNAFPIFTVIRDPIERFLSAVQQVMHYNIEFRTKCLKDQTQKTTNENTAAARRQLINCAINDMVETNYRRDVHLLPMVAHFRLLDGNSQDGFSTNISVSVFYMNHLEHVLNAISNDSKESETQSNAIHARDRSNEDYATSPVLAKLSIDDCTEEMIRQLCILYHVDYVLLKSLGFGHDVTREKCIKVQVARNHELRFT